MTAPFDFNDSPNFKQVMRDYLSATTHELFNHSFHPGRLRANFPLNDNQETAGSRRFAKHNGALPQLSPKPEASSHRLQVFRSDCF
jgi:hypothetical protein